MYAMTVGERDHAFLDSGNDTKSTDQDDPDVILAASGDREAFSRLYLRNKLYFYSVVNRVEVRRFRVRASEDDILQTAMLSASEQIVKIRGKSEKNFRNFVSAIIRTTAIDVAIENTALIRSVRRETGQVSDNQDGTAEMPHEKAIRTELIRSVNENLDRLPEACAEAVRLTAMEGLSYRRAADRMGVSVRSIRTLVRDAKNSFRRDQKFATYFE